MITVVTSWGPKGWKLYGQRFVETFTQYWPESVRLIVYHEGTGHCPPGVRGVDLLDTEPCKSFLSRHRDNRYVRGEVPYPGTVWKRNVEGRNFRFDAYKFARKVFAIAHAAHKRSGKLFWIDGDVATTARVPETVLHDLLPDDVSLCYLARPGYHSECGFVGYNLALPVTREFLAAFERLYAADEFFQWGEWHDSWLFDRLVERFDPPVKLIPHNHRGQPFDNSPALSPYMTHLKGKRKKRDRAAG